MWETLLVAAACSAVVVVFVYKTASLLEFVVTTRLPPAGAEAAIQNLVRPRAAWSPYPVVSARIVESVGGANIHVRQKPRMFWWPAMAVTLLLFLMAKAWSYALHKPLSDQLFTLSARWLYVWTDTFPGFFAVILAVEAAMLIGGLFYARAQFAYRGENA